MNESPAITISSKAEFLAHVIALKHESEERLQNMADCLSEHNNPEAAEVFSSLSSYIGKNLEQLETMAAGLDLPEIPPWDFQWHCSNDPEALCMDHAHYLMSARESLELALFNEQRSVDFFNRVYAEVGDSAVKELALQQIKIEQQFSGLIRQRLEQVRHQPAPAEDLDPPNMPE